MWFRVGMRILTEQEAFDLEFQLPQVAAQSGRQSERNDLPVRQISAWEGVREAAETDMPGRNEAKWVHNTTIPGYALRDEAAERAWLTNEVLCLLSFFGHGCVEERQAGGQGSLGLADWDALVDRSLRAVGEGKSRRNLHLRGSAADVVRGYNGDAPRARDTLQQLFYYMYRNQLKCGFVSSSEVTYFVRLWVHGGVGQLQVSDPVTVGCRGYLRAWAWFLRYAATQEPCNWREIKWGTGTVQFPPSPRGRRTVTPPSRSRDSKRTRKSTTPSAATKCSKRAVVVTTSQLDWKCPVLGTGRHGAVRAVDVCGQRVALKEFVDRQAFEKEVRAYEVLKPLQGKVIPRLLFVGRTEGYERVLGLELGKPLPDDFSLWTEQQLRERDAAVLALRRAGFEQEDFEGRNFVVLPSSNCVAVVDLESLRPLSRRKRKATVGSL